jgi:hypothetical protein
MRPSPYLSISSRGWASGSPRPRRRALAVSPAGCSHRTPHSVTARLWLSGLTGCSRCAPSQDRGATSAAAGCNRRSHGVQPVAPEPSREPSTEPSAASAHALQVPATAGTAGGGPAVGEFFAVLGDGWRLTADQRARLAPAVQAALEAGWLPQALAAFTGANTAGVRNPYAVLAARLSPAELPPQQQQRPARPPWCGECDEVTRMLGFDGDAPRPCPHCKPRATASRAARRDNGPLSRLGSCGMRR